jgi:hypothetical protein
MIFMANQFRMMIATAALRIDQCCSAQPRSREEIRDRTPVNAAVGACCVSGPSSDFETWRVGAGASANPNCARALDVIGRCRGRITREALDGRIAPQFPLC